MLRALIRLLFPRLMPKIEAESRQWMIQCPKCRHEVSVWDSGGMRYRARGTVYRFGRCRGCGALGMLRVYRDAQ